MRLTPKQKEMLNTVNTLGAFTAVESHNGRSVRGIREVNTGLKLVEFGLVSCRKTKTSDEIGYSYCYVFSKIE